jgi:hypothetical protein
MTAPLLARAVHVVHRSKSAMRRQYGSIVGDRFTVRAHPDTVRAMMLEEGVDPDHYLKLAGHRLAGCDLIVDAAVAAGSIALESEPYVTEVATGDPEYPDRIRVEQLVMFRATVTL